MFLAFIRKSGLALSLLAATCTYAETAVRCPSASSIQQAAQQIDKAVKFSNVYSVYTSADVFTENKIAWSVYVTSVAANSHEEAIAKGKKTAQNATIKQQEYATEITCGELLSCTYGPGAIVAYGHHLGMR